MDKIYLTLSYFDIEKKSDSKIRIKNRLTM